MNTLFIIDMMPFLYKGHFVFLKNPRITASGINTSALIGLANGLSSILKKGRPTHVVFAMDPGSPTFRHEAYPAYKAQRQKMPEDLASSIPRAFELADALGIPVVRVDGFDYTQSVARGKLGTAQMSRQALTYYGPGYDFVPSVTLNKGQAVNFYREYGDWFLVYRSGHFLWLHKSNLTQIKYV